jgi:hypothetical protein
VSEERPAADEFLEDIERDLNEAMGDEVRPEPSIEERVTAREIPVEDFAPGDPADRTEERAEPLEEPWLEQAEDRSDEGFAAGLEVEEGPAREGEEATPQAEGGRRKRRRRRGRKNEPEREARPVAVEDEGPEEAAPEELDEEVYASDEEPAAAEEEDDEDLVLDLTNWNVPSWAELVAGLYRPER